MPKCLKCGGFISLQWSKVVDEEYGTLSGSSFEYLLCAKCEVLSISNPLDDILERIYPKNYYSYSSNSRNILLSIKFWFDRRFYAGSVAKINEDKDTLRVLDIGGGSGYLLNNFRKSVKNVKFVGSIIDLDSNAEQLAKLNGFEFIKGSFPTKTFNEGTFEIVLAYNVFEHVSNPEKFLSEAYKILAPKGLLIVQTPNWMCFQAKVFRKKYWGGLHAPRHFSIYSIKSLENSLENNGFEIINRNKVLGGSFWAFSILAMFNRENKNNKPLHKNKLFIPLVVIFSLFDFFYRLFGETSQQAVIAKKT